MNERFAQIEPFVIQRAANRLISFFIALVFLTTSATEHGLLWAQGVPSLGGAELQGAGLYSQAGFTVPADLGVVREYRAASNADAPFVIHIQDAHANVDAQKSIQGLLGWLSRQPEGERMTVYLEGASGSIHPEYLRLFGEYPEINEAVVQDLASKGELNGVELYAWEGFKKGLTAEAFRVEGVEQADLYRDNLTTYREILARQDSIAGLLSPLNKKLELAESRILSAELREFFKERSRRKLGQYENGSGSPQLGAYLSYLAGTVKKELQIDLDERIEQVRFPNLVRLLVLEQIEKKADRAASERERTKVMEMLRVHAGTEEERTLLENFERMDASMDARGIAEKLWAFAASRGVDLKGYTQMWKSAGAVVLRSEIESEGLFAEMDTLESALIEKWIRSEQERKLVGMLRDTELIEKLLALKWTPKDESQYLSRPQDILENVFGTELDKLLNESSEPDVAKRLTLDIQGLRREVDSALHFYETARERDAVIMDRTLKAEQGGRMKVLVTGGFHTPGLTDLIRRRGAGYAVIQPHIARNDNGKLYHDALMEKNNDVSAYFEEPVLNKQQALFFKAYMETAIPLLWDRYRVPHAEMAEKVAQAMKTHPVLAGTVQASAVKDGSGSSLEVAVQTTDEPVVFSDQGVALTPLTSDDFSRVWKTIAGTWNRRIETTITIPPQRKPTIGSPSLRSALTSKTVPARLSLRSELRTVDERARDLMDRYNIEPIRAATDILASLRSGVSEPADLGGGFPLLRKEFQYGEAAWNAVTAEAVLRRAIEMTENPRASTTAPARAGSQSVQLNTALDNLRALRQEIFEDLRFMPNDSLAGIPNFAAPVDMSKVKDGFYIGLDIGGTNARMRVIEVKEGRVENLLLENVAIPDDIKRAKSPREFFSFYAEAAVRQLKANPDALSKLKDQNKPISLGFTFSFEVDQRGPNEGYVLKMSKGFFIPGLVGTNVVQALQNAFDETSEELGLRINVKLLLNDTTATALASPGAQAGLILGTGFNLAIYAEAGLVERILEQRGLSSDQAQAMFLNLEMGGAGDKSWIRDFQSPADRLVDLASNNPGQHLFEKMISGAYLGQVVAAEMFLRAKGIENPSDDDLRDLVVDFKRASAQMTTKSVIEFLNERSKRNFIKSRWSAMPAGRGPQMAVREWIGVITTVFNRSAGLVAASLAASREFLGKDTLEVAEDGPVYAENKFYQDMLKLHLELLGVPDNRIQIKIAPNASSLGAALAAASEESTGAGNLNAGLTADTPPSAQSDAETGKIPALRTTPAGFNVEEKISVGGLNSEQSRVLDLLVAEGQTQLFDEWAAAGTDEEQKRAFLDQASELDRTYPGGLVAYRANAVKLLTASAKGENPLAGFSPSVPELVDLTRLNADFEARQARGLAGANKLAFVMVAGGLGERLGYDGIKIAIPQSLLTGQTYAEWYGRNIRAFQDRANAENGESVQVPFVIMTSNDTDARTRELLAETDNLGLAPEQIKIVKQGAVPALVNNNADFVTEPENPYELQTKPHGHGDVHMLIHRDDLVKQWKAQGVTHVVFIQDTNGQVFNSVLPGLTVSKELGLDMNFFTVPRDAGEAAGAITKLTHTDGRVMVGNVEYNQLGPLLKATVNPAGDVADTATGYSPYPGNLNVFALEIDAYLKLLNQTQGVIQEFINPKYADETKTRFNSPTRSETMMQDAAFAMPGEVGATNFDKRTVFSPVKNNLVVGAAKRDAMATGESDFYQGFRRQLEAAGVKISVVGPERVTRGVKYEDGAKIVLDPSFAVIQEDVRKKFKGGSITDESSLVVEGAGVKLENLSLDGALRIRAVPGANVTIRNLTVKNQGARFIDLTDEEMDAESVPAYLKIRGYRLKIAEEVLINVTAPGNYVIDGDSIQGSGVYESNDGVLVFRSELRRAVADSSTFGFSMSTASLRAKARGTSTLGARIPDEARNVSQIATAGVFATAERLAARLRMSYEEALAMILRELTPNLIAEPSQWNRAEAAARQALGDALYAQLVGFNSAEAVHAMDVMRADLLRSEATEMLIAFALLSRPRNRMTIFIPPDHEEPLSANDIQEIMARIQAQATRLGGGSVADRLTLTALRSDNGRMLRGEIVRRTSGRNSSMVNMVLSRLELLESLGMVKGLSRVNRGGVEPAIAGYIAPALLRLTNNDLNILDLESAMKAQGYTQDAIARVTLMIKALQKIAAAA